MSFNMEFQDIRRLLEATVIADFLDECIASECTIYASNVIDGVYIEWD